MTEITEHSSEPQLQHVGLALPKTHLQYNQAYCHNDFTQGCMVPFSNILYKINSCSKPPPHKTEPFILKLSIVWAAYVATYSSLVRADILMWYYFSSSRSVFLS